MDLYKEILIKILEKETCSVFFPNLTVDAFEIMQLQSYIALNEIKLIIHDESLNDIECYEKIEKIICILEKIGSDGGPRHDFG